MDLTTLGPKWPGWYLCYIDPDNGVGSWLLHHNGEAVLLEVPSSTDFVAVLDATHATESRIRYITASHEHCDHYNHRQAQWFNKTFLGSTLLRPRAIESDAVVYIGDFDGPEPVYIIKAPKHSQHDQVVVFRGVAMTGDIELGTLESVLEEVHPAIRRRSMEWLRGFERRSNYHVHTVVSAHLNDVRENVDWKSLFAYKARVTV